MEAKCFVKSWEYLHLMEEHQPTPILPMIKKEDRIIYIPSCRILNLNFTAVLASNRENNEKQE